MWFWWGRGEGEEVFFGSRAYGFDRGAPTGQAAPGFIFIEGRFMLIYQTKEFMGMAVGWSIQVRFYTLLPPMLRDIHEHREGNFDEDGFIRHEISFSRTF
jgi:hypothetical protein